MRRTTGTLHWGAKDNRLHTRDTRSHSDRSGDGTHGSTDQGTVDSDFHPAPTECLGSSQSNRRCGEMTQTKFKQALRASERNCSGSRWYSAQMSTVSLAALLRPTPGTAVSKESKLPFRIQTDATVRPMAPARASSAAWHGANWPWYSTLRYRTARSCSLAHGCGDIPTRFLQDL